MMTEILKSFRKLPICLPHTPLTLPTLVYNEVGNGISEELNGGIEVLVHILTPNGTGVVIPGIPPNQRVSAPGRTAFGYCVSIIGE
jgi:hypothetical protein